MKSSLSVKFIALITPILLGVFGIFVALHEWHNYANAREDLRLRMNMMAASQSIILAESVANKDIDRLSLQLATVISDPDLVGVVVLDAENRILDEFGDISDGDADLVTEVPINYSDGDGVRVVGTLCLVMTDRNLLADVRAHMITNGLLVLALLVAAILTAILTHRRTVLRPLDRLLAAIESTARGPRDRVDWQSDDEIGRLIRSYNEMQERLEGYERELRTSAEQLEQRVEERTHDLERARESAVEANRVKSKFLSSMSHEFRTPMNAILGFTQVLQMAPELAGNPRLKDRLIKIQESAQNLMALLDQIMDFSQLESADDELHLEPVDPATVIREAVTLVAPLAESRHVTVEIDDNIPVDARIDADTFKLRKALFHLLSNAIKYNRPGGRVDVAVARGNGRVCIAVADTGQGIPAAQFQRIFEPFNRLGREAGSIDGSGIGLTLTRRIVENMSGEIDFESVEGEGSVFRLWFPAVG